MATKTPKYELQKKEDNDFYNIEDLNANWDKVEKALTEFDDSGTAAGITSFTDMLTKFVTGNKLAVTLRNLKAGLQFVLHAGSIVNNCVTDNAGLPLSAAQGKVLMDKYTQLYSDLSVEISDLTHLLNQKYHDATAERYLRIYRVGHIKILSISFKANALTGHDIIATDIPETLLPSIACYAAIQGRDTGGWASATYAPVILGLGGKSVIISTGDKASKVTYISGTVTYI